MVLEPNGKCIVLGPGVRKFKATGIDKAAQRVLPEGNGGGDDALESGVQCFVLGWVQVVDVAGNLGAAICCQLDLGR